MTPPRDLSIFQPIDAGWSAWVTEALAIDADEAREFLIAWADGLREVEREREGAPT